MREYDSTLPKVELIGNFEIDYDASILLGDSAHQAMIVSDDNDNKWVMKSNDVSFTKARNEIDMLEKFQKEGIPTLPLNGKKPLLIKSNGEDTELYLPYVEGLQPLTRLDWGVYVGTESYKERLKDVRACVGLAAKMHRRGFTHGDFQIKNIGQLRSGKYISFDLENSAEIFENTGITDRAKDLVSLLKSIRLNGLYADTNIRIIEDEVSNILFYYAEKFELDEKAINVVEIAQKQFIEWVKDPDAVNRALSRFTISRSLTK